MSRIPTQFLKKSITQMLTTKKQRKFVETVELQIGLRDYDPEKDKRFQGSIRLPNKPHLRLKVCVIGSVVHLEEAKAAGIDTIDAEGLKAFNKDKNKIKKWAKKYDVLIASDALLKQLTKLVGNIFVKLQRHPLPVNEGERVVDKIEELKHSVKFQLKKVLCLGTAIGHADLTEEQIRQNITLAVNFLVSLLKKGWQNIRTLHIKTTMSPSVRIYG